MPAAGFKPTTIFSSSQVLYHLNCGFQRNLAQVFSAPLPSTHFREQTDGHVNSWSEPAVIDVTDRWTDYFSAMLIHLKVLKLVALGLSGAYALNYS